jgi:hypothetical protein
MMAEIRHETRRADARSPRRTNTTERRLQIKLGPCSLSGPVGALTSILLGAVIGAGATIAGLYANLPSQIMTPLIGEAAKVEAERRLTLSSEVQTKLRYALGNAPVAPEGTKYTVRAGEPLVISMHPADREYFWRFQNYESSRDRGPAVEVTTPMVTDGRPVKGAVMVYGDQDRTQFLTGFALITTGAGEQLAASESPLSWSALWAGAAGDASLMLLSPGLPHALTSQGPEPITVYLNPSGQRLPPDEQIVLSVAPGWQPARLAWAARVVSGSLSTPGQLSATGDPFVIYTAPDGQGEVEITVHGTLGDRTGVGSVLLSVGRG